MSDDILDSLPVINFFRKCAKCGATDWTACNLTPDNRTVTDCNRCPDKPTGMKYSPRNYIGGYVIPDYGYSVERIGQYGVTKENSGNPQRVG